MKRRISFLLSFLLLFGVMILPTAAAGTNIYSETQVIHTQYGDFEVETTLIIHDTMLLSDTKRGEKIQSIKYDGEVVAEVTLSATFGYDGKTAWVEKTGSSHSTYDGWSYSEEEITTSIGTTGTAKLTARLTKFLFNPANVAITINCTKDGKLS